MALSARTFRRKGDITRFALLAPLAPRQCAGLGLGSPNYGELAEGRPELFQGTLIDSTAQKKAQASLR